MTDQWPEYRTSIRNALDLQQFREMDYLAIEHYNLPIVLMMEHAGWSLALSIAAYSDKHHCILIGVGSGNNGGGGLVAARHLLAWGYQVWIDLPYPVTSPLLNTQLNRALAFGARRYTQEECTPDLWVDAYLGFSQRLPLSPRLAERIRGANALPAVRIALDIPTGLGERPSHSPIFNAQLVLTLAAPKKILFGLDPTTDIWIGDLGIPSAVYRQFHIDPPPFDTAPILRWIRTPVD